MSTPEHIDWHLIEPPEDPFEHEPITPPTPIRPTENLQYTPMHHDQMAAPAVADAGPVWDGEPVPLKTDRMLRPFPVDVLPEWLGEMVAAVAEATQTPIDLAGCVALACLSTAAGGKVLVQVDRSWLEQVNLYTVTALPPGSRKSPVFRAMTGALKAAQAELRAAAAPRITEAATLARVANARAEKLAKAAEVATANPADALADATAAAIEAAELVIPAEPKLITDDVTPEACVSLMAAQGGRIAVLSAEGDVFATLTGTRYSAAPNLAVFLKAHVGDSIEVDRKGRESESIDRPAMTLGVTTQPTTIQGLASQPGFRDRGVLGRILYSLPANTVGQRNNTPTPVPEPTETTYSDALQTLVLILADHDTPQHLELTPDARQVLLDFQDWIEPRLHPRTGQLAPITDWASKLAGHVVRIAALLHLAHTFTTGYTAHPITADTMRDAERIGRYYLDHALAVYDLMGRSDPDLDDAREVLAWINEQGGETFARRDLLRAKNGRSGLNTAADLEAPLRILMEHGYIRLRESKPGRGRPSIAYDVHPAAFRTQ
jgi:replicative DNA helicase